MTAATSNSTLIFSSSTRTAFLNYVRENPNNRRVSQTDREIIIEWITNSSKRPSSQEEFSRRNYVRKTFAWDENTQSLLAISKTSEDKRRMVVTDDVIVDVVESAHEQNGHLGWDATWRDVSASYYGILRSDVIFLLKQCQLCAQNPSKRPKGATSKSSLQTFDPEVLQTINTRDIQYGNEVWESVDNKEGSCY
jgi:Integrase zinc binding domain